MITQERLKEVLSYDQESGNFHWIKSGKGTKAGALAGWIDNGYVRISIDQRKYLAHKLVWLYVHGFVATEIDHINLNRSDNSLKNLRVASHSNNLANTKIKSTNKSGFKGVCWCKKRKMWRASINKNYKHIHLGFFDDLLSARDSYIEKANEIFGEFARA
jgi:hypothetical protein